MAEARQDSQTTEEGKDGGGDCVSDLGLDSVRIITEKEEAPAPAPAVEDAVEEVRLQDPPALDAAEEIVNEIKTPPQVSGEQVSVDEPPREQVSVDEPPREAELEEKSVDLVKDATKLLEKLEIAESSEGGGSTAEDDLSSSMDSTANSGPRQPETEETPSDDKTVSGEESLDGGATERPKKRIDLQHQFVRGIVKIQHDRDQYEKQCQTRKLETLKDRDASTLDSARTESRSSGASSRRHESSKRQHSSLESVRGTGLLQKPDHLRIAAPEGAQDQHLSRNTPYRPPGLRNSSRSTSSKDETPRSGRSHKDSEETPENVGIKITFDTEKQRRSIQLSKPSVSPSDGENLLVTFDTTRRERHIEATGCTRIQPQLWSERFKNTNTGALSHRSNGGELSPDFQFKATAGGNDRPTSARVVHGHVRFKGSKPLTDASPPKRTGDKQGFLVVNSRKGKQEEISPPRPVKEKGADNTTEPPVKSKPLGDVKWSDIVESESEASPTPDVLESNHWKSPTGSNNNSGGIIRRRGGPKKPRQKNPFQQLQKSQSETPSSQGVESEGGRRSVWERLGPRPWLDRPASLRGVQYEPGSMATMREMEEREYLCREDFSGENSEPSAVQAAYKDTKQKRSRMELYVPRRGGSQLGV